MTIRHLFSVLAAVAVLAACNKHETRPVEPSDCPPDPPPRDTLRLAIAPDAPHTITGRITSAWTAEPIGEANVILPALQRVVKSDEAGGFRMDSIPPGTYDLAVRGIGYKTLVIHDLRISATAGQRIAVPLVIALLDGCPGFMVMVVRKPWWKLW